MLIMARNKVTRDELAEVETPLGDETHFPIPHIQLVEEVEKQLKAHGFEILEEDHALARKGLRYFGGFAVTSPETAGSRRRLVVGMRNSHDKGFAAALVLGNHMIVCENLCFSSEVKLARKHTKNIMRDLSAKVAEAISLLVNSWINMEERISAYERTEISEQTAQNYLVQLVDVDALPARDLYKAVKLFRNPTLAAAAMVDRDEFPEGEEGEIEYLAAVGERGAALMEEFGTGTVWAVYNAVTEVLKGSDMSKLPARTMKMQSYLDAKCNFTAPHQSVDLEESPLESSEQEANFRESFTDEEIAEAEIRDIEGGQL